jgi:hypothetical protein
LDLAGNLLPFVQPSEAGALNRTDVHENIFAAGVLLNEALASRTRLVAEQQLAVSICQFVDQTPHGLRGILDLAEEAHFAWRPSSATATEIFSLDVSRPTNTLLFRCMARPLFGRLGAGPSGAILAIA